MTLERESQRRGYIVFVFRGGVKTFLWTGLKDKKTWSGISRMIKEGSIPWEIVVHSARSLFSLAQNLSRYLSLPLFQEDSKRSDDTCCHSDFREKPQIKTGAKICK